MARTATLGTAHAFDAAALEVFSLGQQHVGQLRTVGQTLGFVMAKPATTGGYEVLDRASQEDLRQAQALIFGALARIHKASTGN